MRLAVIGEPEAAMRIEDDVVGATQRRAGGLGVERLDRTAGDIDALDRPAGIIGGGAVRDQQPIRLDPAETTVVAAIELAVGADRGAVEAAAGFGHGLLGAIRSEEHTSELQSLMRISYAVFCLKKKN